MPSPDLAPPASPRRMGFYRIRAEFWIDSDADGVLDADELAASMDPFNADSDGDGYSDGYELETDELGDPLGSPLDADFFPEPVVRLRTSSVDLYYVFDDYTQAGIPPGGDLRTIADWPTAVPSIEEELSAPIPYQQLAGRLTSTQPLPSDPRLSDIVFGSGPVSALGWAITDAPPPCYHAELSARRVWVEVQPCSESSDSHQFLRMTEMENDSGSLPASFEIVSLQIPPRQHFSGSTDLKPVVTTSGETVKVSLASLGLKINGTSRGDDDFIAVSNGVDEDLATDFSIENTDLAGFTAELSVKNSAGDAGDIKFKDASITFSGTGVAQTKLWGVKTSKARNSTSILIKIKKPNGDPLPPVAGIEAKVTVFEGIQINFGGKFYCPVDTREFLRRPSDGIVKNPAAQEPFHIVPPEFAAKPYFDAAMDEDTRDVSGKLVFSEGDQGVTMRTWAPEPAVTVYGILTKEPYVILAGQAKIDPTKRTLGKVAANSGAISQTNVPDIPQGGSGLDLVVNPRFRFYYNGDKPSEDSQGNKHCFELRIQDRDDDTRMRTAEARVSLPAETLAENLAYREHVKLHALAGGEAENLGKWAVLQRGSIDDYADQLGGIKRTRATWENDSFGVVKGTRLKLSGAAHELKPMNSLLRVSAKGMASWAEVEGDESVECKFFELGEFDEWILTGELKGHVRTK